MAKFLHLKLHGSALLMGPEDYSYNKLFRGNVSERLGVFKKDHHEYEPPPIIFPWELFDDTLEFITEKEFPFIKHLPPNRSQIDAMYLYKLYRHIWASARHAVNQAQKISFVGLSAHPYLETGLKYLFKDKAGNIEVVVANPENKEFEKSALHLPPASPRGKFEAMLRTVAPDMTPIRSTSDSDGIEGTTPTFPSERTMSSIPTMKPMRDITPRASFSEFIQREMD